MDQRPIPRFPNLGPFPLLFNSEAIWLLSQLILCLTDWSSRCNSEWQNGVVGWLEGASMAGCCTFDEGTGFPLLWEHNVPPGKEGESWNLGFLSTLDRLHASRKRCKTNNSAGGTRYIVTNRGFWSDCACCVGRNKLQFYLDDVIRRLLKIKQTPKNIQKKLSACEK